MQNIVLAAFDTLDIYYMMILIWLGVFFVAIWIETQTHRIDTFWFIGSSAIALMLAISSVPWQWQIYVFLISSVIGYIFLRIFKGKSKELKGYAYNAERFVGQTTRVLPGRVVYVNGKKYQYICDEPVKAGDKVSIISVHDRKLKVRKMNRV
jgi:membrane protein implicated in regulation of membrane protease activity